MSGKKKKGSGQSGKSTKHASSCASDSSDTAASTSTQPPSKPRRTPRGSLVSTSESEGKVQQSPPEVQSFVSEGFAATVVVDEDDDEGWLSEVRTSGLEDMEGGPSDTNQRSSESLLRSFVGLPTVDPEAEPHVTSKEMLQRLYAMLPVQLCASYRPNAAVPPEATADANIRLLKEWRGEDPDENIYAKKSRTKSKLIHGGRK